MWSRRNTGSDTAALKVVGTFALSTEARFGVFCGSGDDEMYGVTMDTDGAWSFVSIGPDGVEVLEDDVDAGIEVTIGAPVVMGLDCAGTATGALRMILNLTNSGPIAIYEQQDGPASFDRLGAYAESHDESVSIRLEDIVGFGSGDPDGAMDADAADLLAHVPTDWQEVCWDTPLPPIFGANATAQLTCFIGDVSAAAEIAEYVQFATTDDMDAAYGTHVERFPVLTPVESCEDGPGEHSYSIGSQETGNVLCADQFFGLRYVWTDDRLDILSTLVDHDGSYTDTYQDWLEGGPNV
jgi:hypothetical protein